MTEADQRTDAEAKTRPVVRLRPKRGGRFKQGAPWVYGDELVLDRRTKALAPGTLAELQDAERRPLGLVAVNSGATLAARLIDRDPAAVIDAAWFSRKLRRALDLRAPFFETPFYRLVHAEADGLPGVVIDRFGGTVAIQPNAAWADARLDALIEAVTQVVGASNIVINAGSRTRALEGLDDVTHVAAGSVDGPLPAPMNGATYMADLLGGQKTGLFFDQRPNHAFAAQLSASVQGGAEVLDVFSHVGGFGLAALAAGAKSALAVDGSAAALELAEEGARRTGVSDRFTTLRSDAFDAMRGLALEGRSFDVVVCDPPAFAPSKSALANGLRAYEKVARLSVKLVKPGGWLCLCSCSHAVDLESFRTASARGIASAGRRGAIVHTGRAGPDHPAHPMLPESAYLKALFLGLE